MKVRLSPDLRQKIQTAARDNNRTMNAEIGARLEQSFRKEGRAASPVQSLEERLARLEGLVSDLLNDDPFNTMAERVSALEKRIK
jgi:hypothetical protein